MKQLEGFVASRLVRQELPVPLRTLSELLDEAGVERVDLLKIDVQNSELQVLEGIREEPRGLVRQIALEAHDKHGGDTVRALIWGFALNNDGAQKAGYTAPSVERRACRRRRGVSRKLTAPRRRSGIRSRSRL